MSLTNEERQLLVQRELKKALVLPPTLLKL